MWSFRRLVGVDPNKAIMAGFLPSVGMIGCTVIDMSGRRGCVGLSSVRHATLPSWTVARGRRRRNPPRWPLAKEADTVVGLHLQPYSVLHLCWYADSWSLVTAVVQRCQVTWA
jgi:hypothetical protein